MRSKRRLLACIGAVLAMNASSACSILTKLDGPGDGPGALDAGGGEDTALDACSGTACSADSGHIVDAPPTPDDTTPPDYGALFVSQSFPLATTALSMTEGQVIPSYIEMKNSGTTPWDSNTMLGTTEPRNRTSVFADTTWVAPDRPAAVTGVVKPGATFKFMFDLKAPEKTGTFYEYFGLVNGNVWFGDVGQGGPADNDLEVQIVVTQ
jgi:hypothetical protein